MDSRCADESLHGYVHQGIAGVCLPRPGSAPASSDWTQVHAIVKSLLGDVAFNVANADVPVRPHTACAGARLFPVAFQDDENCEDTESDGGSLDLEDDRAHSTFVQNVNVAGNAVPDKVEGEPYIKSQPSAPSLSKGEWLLLSGLAGKVKSEASVSDRATSSCSGETRPKVKVLPVSLAEKLPRTRVLQVGGSRGMAPQASRLKSHTSWTNFLPIRTRDEPQAGRARKVPAPVSEHASGYPVENIQVAQSSTDELKPFRRQAGPKYHVLPGGSRPARTEPKAKMAKEFVLEFRSEPRVVPARRFGQDQQRHRRGQKCSETTSLHRFRQEDGRWALEREALANI